MQTDMQTICVRRKGYVLHICLYMPRVFLKGYI